MDRYDVAIVGAGPAGSLAALILARAGRRVVLFDKARFPRPKVCGDCLNPRVWALWRRHGLEEGFAKLEHGAVRRLEIQRDGERIYGRAIEGDFRAVDRAMLDQWLLDEARAAGAEVREETPVQRIDEIDADFILGADGRNSMVAQQAGLAPKSRRDGRIGWQAILSGVEAGDAVRMNVFRGGYYGVVALDRTGQRADLAMVLETAARLDPRAVVERFFSGARLESLLSTAPIARRPALPARDRVWLAGDAARVVEPFTGEGIYFALASAEAAAETLRDGWGASAEELAGRYRRRHRALYAGELRINGLTRWLLSRSGRGRVALQLLRHSPRLLDRFAAQVLQ